MRRWHVVMGPHRFVVKGDTPATAATELCGRLNLERLPCTFSELDLPPGEEHVLHEEGAMEKLTAVARLVPRYGELHTTAGHSDGMHLAMARDRSPTDAPGEC